MILSRIIEHVKAQNWTAIALDFVIVVMGVFIGIQFSNWNNRLSERDTANLRLAEMIADMDADIEQFDQVLSASSFQVTLANDVLATALSREPMWALPGLNPDIRVPASPPWKDFDRDYIAVLSVFLRTVDTGEGAWETLIGTGEIRLIRNGELTQALQAYQGRLTEYLDLESMLKQVMWETAAERRTLGIGFGQTMPENEFIALVRDDPVVAAGLVSMRTFGISQFVEVTDLRQKALDLRGKLQAELGE